MTAEKFTAGRYCTQGDEGGHPDGGDFNLSVHTVEGTTPPSRYRPSGADSVHRDSVKQYVPHDTNHAPYESAKRRNAPQTSLAPNGDSVDLGLVTKKQHQMLSKRSQKGKKKAVE